MTPSKLTIMKQYQCCGLAFVLLWGFSMVSPARAQQPATQADMTQAQSDIQTLKTVTDQLRDQIKALTQSLADKETALNLSISQTPSAGTVVAFAGDAANVPSGWHLCDGAETSTDSKPFNSVNFPALWSAIGPANGGDATLKTFHLPDYRGYFLRGVDTGQGRDSDATTPGGRSASAAGGNAGDAVGSVEPDMFKSHVHEINDPGHFHPMSDFLSNTGGPQIAGGAGWWAHSGKTEAATTGITILAKGGSETRPKNVSVNWIIKLK